MSHRPDISYTFGAHFDGKGVQFSIFSAHATAVTLCLFNGTDAVRESKRIELSRLESGVWATYVDRLRPGQLYGYRVQGPWQPERGAYFNSDKVVLDPYAHAVARNAKLDDALLGSKPVQQGSLPERSTIDSAPFAPLAAVVDPVFDWQGDALLNIPWNKTVIYEAHVKGMTAQHPEVEASLRGTYLGLCSPAIIEHLTQLGVTAIELLPVHQHTDEFHIHLKGLENYWGYSTLNYFSPDLRYAVNRSGTAHVSEFREMVKTFHRAGIEVILDVVYNHTAEADPYGPMLSFRGVDNQSYYRLLPGDASRYLDFTGCSNTLNTRNPRTLQLITDSLRYWVTEMHVDGFRFDLTSALIRREFDIDLEHGFLAAISQDPILSKVKLIAEPWDCAADGYLVGKFPPPWRDWNGQFRDVARMFWRGDSHKISPLATRISGSSDMFQWSGRGPTASINFVTSHDGFTLRDLLSYSHKHNEANLEENRDGDNNNFCFNCGVEGETADPDVNALRLKLRRNFVATLLLSAGTPMLTAGDELGKTQLGNNNAYCQDNPLSWLSWNLDPAERQFLLFCQRVAKIRHEHPTFQRQSYFSGTVNTATGLKDIAWYLPSGNEIEGFDWDNDQLHTLTVVLTGPGGTGAEIFAMIFHAGKNNLEVNLPHTAGKRFEVMIDTGDATMEGSVSAGIYSITAQSFALLRRTENK